ncbi:MAG: hypothetical protein RJA83_671 [Pseudomonadota bacterium]|jgi:single-strand DNA-binding protein
MRGVNKVILIGNLGKKPDLKVYNGEPYVNFGLATSYKKKNGVEETEWHNVTAFGKKAEIIDNYTEKGSRIFVEGRIKSSEYTTKEGIKKTKTSIICNDMQILSKKTEDNHKNDSEFNMTNDYIPGF